MAVDPMSKILSESQVRALEAGDLAGQSTSGAIHRVIRSHEALRARLAEVEQALRTYGEHLPSCRITTFDPGEPCDCGLAAVLDKGEPTPRCGAFDPSLVALGDATGWRDPLPRCTLERDHPSGWHSSEDAEGRIVAQWRGPHNAAVLDEGEPCPRCGGEGWRFDTGKAYDPADEEDPCQRCGGSGVLDKGEQVDG